MPSSRDPAQMTDDDRIQEVASLFAVAVHRLLRQQSMASSTSEMTLDSSAMSLEVSPPVRLSVSSG